MVTLTTPDTPGAIEVTVWDLEMTTRPAWPKDTGRPADLVLTEVVEPAPELSRFFYELVGADWYWVDRLSWTDEQWWAWVDRPEQHLWTCWSGGAPVGYFELEEQGDGVVELAYFGLVARFHGRGFGKWLLTKAIEAAWALPDVERLWLHTCSLDGPSALGNYQRRGFRICGTSQEFRITS